MLIAGAPVPGEDGAFTLNSAKSNGDSAAPNRGGQNPEQPGDPVSMGLKRLFAAFEEEPIPDDFLRLLDAIDEQRAANATGKKAG